MQRKQTNRKSVQAPNSTPAPKPRLRSVPNDASRARIQELQDMISDLVTDKPEKAATILTSWINQIKKK